MIQSKVLLLTQTCLKVVMFSLGLQYQQICQFTDLPCSGPRVHSEHCD